MKIGLLHYTGPPTVGGVEQTLAFHAHQLVCLRARTGSAWSGRGRDLLGQGIDVRVIPHVSSRHPDVLAVKAELDRGDVSHAFHTLTGRLRQDLAEAGGALDVLIVHNALSLHKNLPLTSALWDLQQAGTWRRTIAWHHDLAWARPEYAAELHPGAPWELLRRPCPGVLHVGGVGSAAPPAGRSDVASPGFAIQRDPTRSRPGRLRTVGVPHASDSTPISAWTAPISSCSCRRV